MKIKIYKDNKSFCDKKSSNKKSEDIDSRIQDSIAKNSVEDLAEMIGLKGQCWNPAVIEVGAAGKHKFVSQQLFALEFDSRKITYREVKTRAMKYGIPIAFAYSMLKVKGESKFCVVFCSATKIENIRVARLIYTALATLYSEVSLKPYNENMPYIGGNDLLQNADSACFDLYILIQSMTEFIRDYDKSNSSKKMKAFAQETGISRINGFPQIETVYEVPSKSDEPDARSIVYIRSAPDSSKYYKMRLSRIKLLYRSEKEEFIDINLKPGRRDLVRKVPLDDLKSKCQLFREFYKKLRSLDDNELIGLASNLIQIEGGTELFINAFDHNEDRVKWADKTSYYVRQNEQAHTCSEFCHYASCEDCVHAADIIDTIRVKRGTVSKLNTTGEYCSLKQAEKSLKKIFNKVVNSNSDKINVIVGQTGIGKSHIYIKHLKTAEKNCIIAVPTNDLKKEIYEKCLENSIYIKMLPSIQDLINMLPAEMQEHIEFLYNIGAPDHVSNYLKENIDQSEEICKYFEQRSDAMNSDAHLIMTHSRLVFLQEDFLQNYDVIIDEDIIPALLDIKTVNIYELKEIIKYGGESIKQKIHDILHRLKKHDYCFCDAADIDEIEEFKKKIIDNMPPISTDVINFFHAVGFYKVCNKNGIRTSEIQYVVRHSLFTNQKYIVMSATADKFMYKRYFGKENVKFFYCDEAKYTGNIFQSTQYSYSRTFISKNKDKFEQIAEYSEGNLLTFKACGYGDQYFGKSSGSNKLENRDIIVAGTPHCHESVYKLYGLALGIKIKGKMAMREVDYNGYRFKFMTYEGKLSKIQLWKVGSELEQAIGRARIIRNNCSVYLFSNFPVKQALFIEASELFDLLEK